MSAPLLKQLFEDLDKVNLRVSRPTKFVFLCGGKTDPGKPKHPLSLRQYLLHERSLAGKLDGAIILAETANQLYRDTSYSDLISFEEDIAELSSTVTVITESAGSLAELGAFTGNEKIRSRVSIISQQEFAHAESFVRFGPIERIKNDDEERVAFFPWRKNSSQLVVKSSASADVGEIANFINRMIAKTPMEESYNSATPGLILHLNIIWLMQLCIGLSLTELLALYNEMFDASVTQSRIKNALYCLQIAKWVDVLEYSNKHYWYTVRDFDPFVKYRYLPGVADTNTFVRRSAAARELLKGLNHPRQVLKHIKARRVV